jgi:hypothetical protein
MAQALCKQTSLNGFFVSGSNPIWRDFSHKNVSAISFAAGFSDLRNVFRNNVWIASINGRACEWFQPTGQL